MSDRFDPTPYLRWLKQFPDSTPVLQVGYRPINGGPVQYKPVPVAIQYLDEDDAARVSADGAAAQENGA